MALSTAVPPGQGNGIGAFFERCGLPSQTRLQCQCLVQSLYPGLEIEEASPQGYCSYTLCVGLDTIIQFRPATHKLSIRLVQAAQEIYGDLVPKVQWLAVPECPPFSTALCQIQSSDGRDLDEGVALDDHFDNSKFLDVVSMNRIRGISLAQFRASQHQPTALQRQSIVRDFASIVATGWAHRRPSSDPVVASLRGRVGGSMQWRLDKMAQHLPRRFQPAVENVRARFGDIMALPWVLTHGDIVPANIMVEEPADGENEGQLVISGLIDWAEAEYLPFGVGLYGLEELLGASDTDDGVFSYFEDRGHLYDLFWAQVQSEIGRQGGGFDSISRELLEAARVLGFLLWHGIAFDDGKLNRVVEEGKDNGEMQRLDAFFQASCKW